MRFCGRKGWCMAFECQPPSNLRIVPLGLRIKPTFLPQEVLQPLLDSASLAQGMGFTAHRRSGTEGQTGRRQL
jgi:hypothetical protein